MAKPRRTSSVRNVLAVTGALGLTASMAAMAHALVTVVIVAAVVSLVARLAFAGRHRLLQRRRQVLLPVPDPELTARTRTIVTSVTVLPIGERERVSLSGPAARRGTRA
jgi:hypothetical protein